MDRDEFESKVLELWTKSRVPLTEANLQYFAGVPERTLKSWLKALVKERVLEQGLDEDGEPEYLVLAGQRALDGPDTPQAYEHKRKLVEEAKKRIIARRAGKTYEPEPEPEAPARKALVRSELREDLLEDDDEGNDDDDRPGVVGMVGRAAIMASGKALVALDKPLSMLDKPLVKGDKSLLVSGGLSLLGPVGWLYAGSFREAVPATLAFIAIGTIVPSFILAPFMLVGSAASALVGLTYAWRFNRNKGRTPLLLSTKKSRKSKEPKS